MTVARVPASFRDPSGFLARKGGDLYRFVSRSYQPHYEALINTGLYTELTDQGLLVHHEEVSPAEFQAPWAYRVLKPSLIPFISYPYEWCFGQLRDAALATLEIQERALARGLILKDATAFNIQFLENQPVLIDTLSFERYREGQPWVAYRQFCQHFLAPLSVMASVDVRLRGILREYLDGVPLDLASRLLPRRSWLRFSQALHIHLHAASIRRFAGRGPNPERKVKKDALLGLLASLTSGIRRLSWDPSGTEWAEYDTECSYSAEGLSVKESFVRNFVQAVKPQMVFDLGANTGRFSRIAAMEGGTVVAMDGDPAACERLYRRLRDEGRAKILPLCVDLTNPSPAMGWAHEERESLISRGPADAVLMLALAHHLAISANVPFWMLADFLARMGTELVVEYVPKTDPQLKRLLISREDIFTDYSQESFESVFDERFLILERCLLPDSGRCLYRMRRR